MIVASLKGGLGNQMFQYAAGRRLAERHDTELVLDASWFASGSRGAETPRRYELDCFSHGAPVETQPRPQAGWIRGRRDPARLRVVKERSFAFDPSVLRSPDNVRLDGYWQCEGYFADVATRVARDFTPATAPDDATAAVLSEIEQCHAVGVHVRRGDYVTGPSASAYHGVLTLDYYAEAMRAVRRRVPDAVFFVVSDDPAWCREHLTSVATVRIVAHNPPDRGAEDMRLLRSCRHSVIANSSFSWWAAWLNPNPDKIVIAPKRWLAAPGVDATDIHCGGWTLL